jgi:DNA phosphorothioation-dependent restriction protein DptG
LEEMETWKESVQTKDDGRQLVITAHITFSPIRYELGTKLNPRIIKF